MLGVPSAVGNLQEDFAGAEGTKGRDSFISGFSGVE